MPNLLDLPLNVRDTIYEYALFPHMILTIKAGFLRCSASTSLLPLLRLNRQVNQEINTRVFSILDIRYRYYNKLKLEVAAVNDAGRKHQPGILCQSPNTMALCSQSPWVIRSDSHDFIRFLRNLSSALRDTIRTLVITRHCLDADDGGDRKAWSKSFQERSSYTPFTRFLLRQLPKLREVALFLPWDKNTDFYCSYAPDDMAKLLEEGRIDVLRFMFAEQLTEWFDFQRDALFMSGILRVEPEGPDYISDKDESEKAWAAYMKVLEASKKAPLKFAISREKGNNCGWIECKHVFALRRQEDGPKRPVDVPLMEYESGGFHEHSDDTDLEEDDDIDYSDVDIEEESDSDAEYESD